MNHMTYDLRKYPASPYWPDEEQSAVDLHQDAAEAINTGLGRHMFDFNQHGLVIHSTEE